LTKALAIAVAIAVLAGCAQVRGTPGQPVAVGGASEEENAKRPHWLRDPARGEYPYSPRGW